MTEVEKILTDLYTHGFCNKTGNYIIEAKLQLKKLVESKMITCGAHERTSSDSCICDKVDKIEWNQAIDEVVRLFE